MSYTVTDAKVKPDNNVTKMEYDSMEEYYTYDSDSKEYTWESEYKICEKYSKIPISRYHEWLLAVMEYINNYNDGLPTQNVTYEILAARNNAMYNYKRYINGTLVDEGWADYGMIPDDETKTWSDAVIDFRKQNDLPIPSEEQKKTIEGIKDVRNSGSGAFDADLSGNLPSIPSALQALSDNPCEFPSEIISAVKQGPTGIMDQFKSKVTAAKLAVDQALRVSTDDFNTAVGSYMDPVIEAVESQVNDVTNEEDAYIEYYRKKFARENELMTQMVSQSDEWLEENGVYDTWLTSGNDSIEIPSWMLENIKEAMNARFKDGAPGESTMSRWNEHKSFFFETFRKQGVPEQMTVLCIIESNVGGENSLKENGCTAKGPWQFLRSTAVDYGLVKVNALGNVIPGTDKRNDFNASTPAAAKSLKKWRERDYIDNWIYAAASYNWGGGNVQKARIAAGKGADIWTVWKRFPEQTRTYVCLLIGLCKYFEMSTDVLFS